MRDNRMERVETILQSYDHIFDKAQDQPQVWRGLNVRYARDQHWDMGFILVFSPEMGEEGIWWIKKMLEAADIPRDKIKTFRELWQVFIELPQDLRKASEVVVMAMGVVIMIIGVMMSVLHVFVFALFFWSCSAGCGILVPWPGTEPGPSAVRAWSPKYWTSRKSPFMLMLTVMIAVVMWWWWRWYGDGGSGVMLIVKVVM